MPVNLVGGQITSASYWSATADIGKTNRRSTSDIVIDATYYNRRGVPYVRGRGDAGSAYRAQQMIADQENSMNSSALSNKLMIGDDRALSNQDNFFQRLRASLTNLSYRLNNIANIDDFNPGYARSKQPDVVDARADILASNGTYRITVERLAMAHEIAGDKQADTYAALNITGTISVNGYAMSIVASDSLADIRDKINYGEDTNHNGTLEMESEDTNDNGTLDSFYQPAVYAGNGNYLPAVYHFEDTDFDGVLDVSEDANGNKLLDGGADNIQAKARIEDGRLIIKNLAGSDTTLRIEDHDDALESLGFYKRDDDDNKLLKTSVDSSFNIEPLVAQFTVNDQSHSSAFNEIDHIIPGLTLLLKATTQSEVEITVARDSTPVVDRIESFTNAYNDAIELINKQNVDHLPAQNNIVAQDIAISLARSASGEVSSLPVPPRSFDEIGIHPQGSNRSSLDIANLEMMDGLAEGALNSKAKGEPTLFARLGTIGVVAKNDFTLSLDREKLGAMVENNPVEVHSVFNVQPDGIGHKLGRNIARAIATPNGMIQYQLEVINYYMTNPSAIQRAIISHAPTTDRISILESITA